VTGAGLEKLKAVKFGKKAMGFSLADDKKSVVLSGLVAAGVTATPSGQEVDFEFESGDKSTVVLDLVNSRIETVERPKN
jgi:cold shock CspA family protein